MEAKGSILFKNEVDFSGTSTFFYTSSQTSTIDVKSSWAIGNNMSLSIGRQTVNGTEPLYLADRSSHLIFNNSTFGVSANGIHLLNGTVNCIGGLWPVDVASTNTSNG